MKTMSIEKYFSRPAKKAQINLADSAQVDTVDAIVERSAALDEEIIKIREESKMNQFDYSTWGRAISANSRSSY